MDYIKSLREKKARNKKIINALKSGLSKSAIAEKYGISRQMVWTICSGENVKNAHKEVRRAVAKGTLRSLNDGNTKCIECGSVAKAYDHRDYTKPLQVEPVCITKKKKRGKGNNRGVGEFIPTKVKNNDETKEANRMTKTEAIALFGTKKNPGTPKMMAQALQITTQAISQWPEELTQRIADRVLGAKERLRRKNKNAADPGTD